jgi:arylsulfatase
MTIRLLCAAATAALLAASAAAADRPDIVVILSDDMGFSDLGCYGGEIRTPHLDALAAGGVRFSRFYNTARCCPTRASLLTGLYPHQAGIGHMMDDKNLPGYKGDLNRNCLTIAEALKPAGYRSYAVGKWHVTRFVKPEGPKHNWPRSRGFDRFYGTITGAGSFYDPATLVRDDTMIAAGADPEYKPERYYYTDAISDHAVRFIADHARDHADQPLFLYVAYTAAHWPMHALEEDIAKYKGKYDAGYEAVRKARYEKAIRLGLIDAKWPMSATAESWEAVKKKEWEARCMEVYAAMIDRMDAGIGRIVAELQRSGRLDDTLILFLQDNGGCAETVGRSPDMERPGRATLPPLKPDEPSAAIRPKQTRDGRPVLSGTLVMPGPDDTYIAYGRGWANVSNTPFREYKHWVHEGGISTPLIAHWPKGIARRGGIEHTPGHLIDVMATCLDISGAAAAYPKKVGDHDITPPEGRSLVPAFAGKPVEREAIYWEHEGNRAVRAGKWKLVAKGPRASWELYDIDADRTEAADLASAHPDVVRELSAKWEAWARRANAVPWIWGPPYGKDAGDAPPKAKKKKKAE